jgi:hypothetical protein
MVAMLVVNMATAKKIWVNFMKGSKVVMYVLAAAWQLLELRFLVISNLKNHNNTYK